VSYNELLSIDLDKDTFLWYSTNLGKPAQLQRTSCKETSCTKMDRGK